MNRRDFLKSLTALPSLALPFVPSFLKSIWGKATGTFEVSGLGFEPKIAIWSSDGKVTALGRNGEQYIGYPEIKVIEPIESSLDIVSFDADGFTLSLSGPFTVHSASFELSQGDWDDD